MSKRLSKTRLTDS